MRLLIGTLISSVAILLTGCATTNNFHHNGQAQAAGPLFVHIQGGTVGTSGKVYTTTSFQLAANECKQVSLNTADAQVPLQACYMNNALYLDPSKIGKYQTKDAIKMNASPIWNRGFTYNDISTNGTAKLNKVDVFVKIAGQND